MSPAERARAPLSAILVGLMLAGLLPAVALAADPVAGDDGFTVGVDSAATTFPVLLNDTDADVGDTLTISSVTDPADGSAVKNGTSIDYTPDASFHGTDTFQYTIEDSTLATSTATVTVIVNDPPIAVDDPGTGCQPPVAFGGSYPIPEDYLEAGQYGQWVAFLGDCALLANDTDPNGDPLTYVIESGPSHGALFPDPDLTAYMPDADFSTPYGDWPSDSITYRAFDGLSYSAPATLRLWVSPINDPPTLTPGGTVTVAEDSGQYSAAWATNVSPGPNESDQTVQFELRPFAVEGNGPGPLFVDLPAIGSTGVLTFSVRPDCWGTAHVIFRPKDDGGTNDPSYGSLTPSADDTADDITFDIVVSADSVSAVNDTATLPEDPDPAPWPVDVLSNDTYPPGATITGVTQGSLGIVTIAADGLSVLYGPQPDANGSDSFTYTLDDGAGSTDTATVDVTIDPVNDASSGGDDTVSTVVDVPYAFGAGDFGFTDPNDTPPNGWLAVTITTLPAVGSLTNDGVGVIAGQSIAVADLLAGKLSFTPDTGESGLGYAAFTFQVQDDGGTAGGGIDLDPTPNTLTIDVTPVNDAPDGTDNMVTTNEDTVRTIAASDFGFGDASDSPPNGLLAVRITTLPAVGSLKDDGVAVTSGGLVSVADITAGKLVFTPAPNGNGSPYAAFTFQAQDDGGTANGGIDLDPTPNTLTIDVTPANDLPNAVNDAGLTVPESAGATTLAVLGNDIDLDGDTLSIVSAGPAAHGTVAITGGGTGLTYDPVQLYYGTDVFTYAVSDGHGGTDTATVLLTVVKDTTAPAVSGPAESFYGQTVGSSTVKVNLKWSGSDAGTGIASYQLQISVDGGAYATVGLASPTTTSINRTLTTGRTYRHRVRATDRQGNVSAWMYGPTIKPGRYQNTSSSVGYAGSWTTLSNTSALGGSHRWATSTGARSWITKGVRDFAWVTTRTTTSGSAQVWIDGVLAATINTRSTTTSYRQLMFARRFPSLGTHRIEIRPIGGGRVYLDAFLVLQ
jgi:Bacterial Ig domain